MNPGEFAHCRRYWLAGRCPCCGGELCSWPGPDYTEYEPEAVAEGVMFCGRCIGNHHHTDFVPGFLEELLQALIP